MRHRKSGRHLNRTSAHRKAMFSNMAASLIEHEVIRTTTVKAKELRRTIEPLITLAKEDSVANRRLAFARLRSKSAVGKLFTDLGPRYQSRPGGYTRILKAGYRSGDATMVAYIELVGRSRPDYDEDVDDQQIASGAAVAEESIEDKTEAAADTVVEEEVTDKETLEATEEVSEVDDSTPSDESDVAEAEATEANDDPIEAEDRAETQEKLEQEPETEDVSEAEEVETDKPEGKSDKS